jgi:hypothetical protein
VSTILILSETHDFSTDEVCAWLNKYQIKYLRLNNEICNYSIDLELNNNKIEPFLIFENEKISFNNFSVIWFRRSYFTFDSNLNIVENKEINQFANTMLNRDFRLFSEYFELRKKNDFFTLIFAKF